MQLVTCEDEQALGRTAAQLGAEAIRAAAKTKDQVTIIVATGASQISMLEHLVQEAGLSWERINVFHLDEYVGISANHPASFRKYLHDRLVSRIENLGVLHEVVGDAIDLDAEVARLNALISGKEVDICFAGIGENGHLAFNDPPADLETKAPYITVELDPSCRQQQCNEGWFDNIEQVPERAITMSTHQILKSKKIIVSVPGKRKAEAVKNTFSKPVSPHFPSSVLRYHKDCHIFTDTDSARLL